METRLNYDPILNTYSILYDVIKRYHTKGLNFEKEIDPLLFKILVSNSCPVSNTNKPKTLSFDVIDEELKIIFVENMMGNAASEYMDFIDIFGTKYIIIFIDYFDEIQDNKTEDDGIEDVLGNFNYIAAIAYIVKFIIILINPITDDLSMTYCAGNRYYKAPIIIATKIINDISPIDPEIDLPVVMEVPWNELKPIITEEKVNIELSLIGVNGNI